MYHEGLLLFLIFLKHKKDYIMLITEKKSNMVSFGFFFNLVVNNIFSLGYYVQTFYFIYFILMHCYCLLDTLCRYLRDS